MIRSAEMASHVRIVTDQLPLANSNEAVQDGAAASALFGHRILSQAVSLGTMTYARYMCKFTISISLLCLHLWMSCLAYMQGCATLFSRVGLAHQGTTGRYLRKNLDNVGNQRARGPFPEQPPRECWIPVPLPPPTFLGQRILRPVGAAQISSNGEILRTRLWTAPTV
jgi:hypothetical protein